MTDGRSNQNLAAVAVLVVMVLYVGSYGVVRFKSFAPGRGAIILGILDGKEVIRASPSRHDEIEKRVQRLRRFYAPLRWVDRRLTGVTL